jgi:lipoate-protein ligase A
MLVMSGIVVWWDPPAGGPENMAADEFLATESMRLDRMLVRLYRWSEPAVSLGGFQRLADARCQSGIVGLPLVRRPSGGGAIVHGSDLTYAVAVPRSHVWGGDPQVLYDAFHAALAEVLQARGIAARQHAGRPANAGDEARFLCFDRRARGDLVLAAADAADGFKVLGSAQRRLQAAVLQHGSLLERSPGGVDETARHPGLAELLPEGSLGPFHDLIRTWIEAVARRAGGAVDWREDSFRLAHASEIAPAVGRFAGSRWLGRR